MYKWLELMPYKIHIASSLYTPLLKIGVGASSQATGFVFIFRGLQRGGGCDRETFYLIGWLVVCELMIESQISDSCALDFSDCNPFSIQELVNHSELPMRQIRSEIRQRKIIYLCCVRFRHCTGENESNMHR